jgi:hypothetical protein
LEFVVRPPKARVKSSCRTTITLQLTGSNADWLNICFHNTGTANASEKWGKNRREKGLEFIIRAGGDTKIEVECNPNLYPDPFKAMVFIKASEKGYELLLLYCTT